MFPKHNFSIHIDSIIKVSSLASDYRKKYSQLALIIVRLVYSSLLCNISNTRDTSRFVKNTPPRVVFSTLFSVFAYPDETLPLVFDMSHEKLKIR